MNRPRMNPARISALAAALFAAASSLACPVGEKPASKSEWQSFLKSYAAPSAPKSAVRKTAAFTPMPVLPDSHGSNGQMPWGGPDATKWRPEAVLANAVAEALNQAWALPGTVDAVVALPVKMLRSDYHPYGDGQTNASVNFGAGWSVPRPPVVAVLVTRSDGLQTVKLKFDRALVVKSPAVDILSFGGPSPIHLPLTKSPEGDYVADWKPTPTIGWNSPTGSRIVMLRLAGWTDAFPLGFRHPVSRGDALLKSVPSASQKLGDGRPLLDPENLATGAATVFERASHHAFGAGYNPTPFLIPNIHAEFPAQGAGATAVGRGWTWVNLPPVAPFKILYTCFERRRIDLEAARGVPSGGGWHEIGDNAETVFNDLEPDPIVVGHASTVVLNSIPGGALAYGLTDLATVRWLKPGEALVTAQGGSVWGYDQGKPLTIVANFHWFMFQQNHEVCTEEWVHPCVPNTSNGTGLHCAP